MKSMGGYRHPFANLSASSDFYKLLESVWQAMSNHNQKTGMFGNKDDAKKEEAGGEL